MEAQYNMWIIQALRMALAPENTTRNREWAPAQHIGLTSAKGLQKASNTVYLHSSELLVMATMPMGRGTSLRSHTTSAPVYLFARMTACWTQSVQNNRSPCTAMSNGCWGVTLASIYKLVILWQVIKIYLLNKIFLNKLTVGFYIDRLLSSRN